MLIIYEDFYHQIRFLQSQAHQILRDIKTDVNLHQAACNFKKVPGKTYYLYQRESGQCYFSMLSPQVSDGDSNKIEEFENITQNWVFYD